MSAQAMEALALANEIRLARAALMRRLRTGDLPLRDLDFDDACLQSMRVLELLCCLCWRGAGQLTPEGSVPRTATRKPRRLMAELRMGLTVKVEALSPARRRQLVDAVERHCAPQRRLVLELDREAAVR